MAADFYIKRHDTRPLLIKSLLDANGNPVNLTGATVVFIMADGDTLIVNRAPATIITPTAGTVSYTWVAANTANDGQFDGEFEVTFSDGGIETFPNPRKLVIVVTDDLG